MLFSVLGFAVLLFRLGPSLRVKIVPRREFKTSGLDDQDSVSIIVPARNEEANIVRILRSLLAIEHETLEIIVVNDASTDRTQEIAESFAGVQVITAPPRPVGWGGKTWACEQGGLIAKGEYLLFTDADTTHEPRSLQRMLYEMKADRLDMMSAVPYHESATWLEKLMGPFHLLVLISSSGFSKPRRRSLFSIGQYLLFRRASYFKIGSHESVKASFCEDLDLAERVFDEGLKFGLDRSGEIFKVRMYASLGEFLAGWRRIFRLGFPHAHVLRAIEVFLVIACLMMSFHFGKATPAETGFALAGLALLAFAQPKFGRFSLFGVLLAPFGIGVFVTVSVLALYDRLRGADLRWRGRSYKMNA